MEVDVRDHNLRNPPHPPRFRLYQLLPLPLKRPRPRTSIRGSRPPAFLSSKEYRMKRLVAALALASLILSLSKDCAPAFGQSTKAQFQNQDGSLSPGVVVECPDPAAAGKATAC